MTDATQDVVTLQSQLEATRQELATIKAKRAEVKEQTAKEWEAIRGQIDWLHNANFDLERERDALKNAVELLSKQAIDLLRKNERAEASAKHNASVAMRAEEEFYDLVFALTGKRSAPSDFAEASKDALVAVERLRLRLLVKRAEQMYSTLLNLCEWEGDDWRKRWEARRCRVDRVLAEARAELERSER